MRITTIIKIRAKENSIEKIAEGYKISVKTLPVDGKANEAIRKLLSKYFKVPLSSVRLVVGQTSKHKVFDIL